MPYVDEEERVPYEFLEGAFVSLKLVGPTPTLAAHFKEHPMMAKAIGALEKLPDEDHLQTLIEDDETLMAWEILSGDEPVGYAFLVFYDGPPYLALFGFDELDMETGKDCLEQMVPVFFQSTDEPALFFYIPRPVPDDVHGELIDGGYDPWEDNPTIDNDAVACYILERYTYDAYYGEGTEGEFEETDEDY